MSNAWETTADDILNVVHQMGKKANTAAIEHIMENLDHFKIEDAALKSNDIDEQTNLAYEEIKRQIIEESL